MHSGLDVPHSKILRSIIKYKFNSSGEKQAAVTSRLNKKRTEVKHRNDEWTSMEDKDEVSPKSKYSDHRRKVTTCYRRSHCRIERYWVGRKSGKRS